MWKKGILDPLKCEVLLRGQVTCSMGHKADRWGLGIWSQLDSSAFSNHVTPLPVLLNSFLYLISVRALNGYWKSTARKQKKKWEHVLHVRKVIFIYRKKKVHKLNRASPGKQFKIRQRKYAHRTIHKIYTWVSGHREETLGKQRKGVYAWTAHLLPGASWQSGYSRWMKKLFPTSSWRLKRVSTGGEGVRMRCPERRSNTRKVGRGWSVIHTKKVSDLKIRIR